MLATIFEILVILLLIFVNGFFSMSEMALVSSRKTRLEQRAESGDSGAGTALQMANTPNRFLSTVQVGVSLVGVLSGAIGGSTLAARIAPLIGKIVPLAPYRDSLAFALVVLLITYFSLVLGELIPKRLALSNPEQVASRVAHVMRTISVIASPVIRLLSSSTELGLRFLRFQPSTEPPVTEEEIKILLDQGTQVGVFEEAEQDMVESVFRLGERRVDALMTPRTDIVWLDIEEPFEELRQIILASPHTRFPVARGNLDNVIGILNSKGLLVPLLSNQPIELPSLLHSPLFIPESTPALRVLEMFKSSGVPLALIIDEYGGVQGMVTHSDVLEAIVGEIATLGQPNESEAVRREDGSWLLGGMLPIDEFKDLLDLNTLPDEDRAGYQTLGGFMMSQLGSIPTPGDHFTWDQWEFEVMDMDGRRVDKVLATRIQDDQASSEGKNG